MEQMEIWVLIGITGGDADTYSSTSINQKTSKQNTLPQSPVTF